MFLPIKSKKAEGIINEIIDQYTYADKSNRPWIIGFSGGKDSTVLLTLVWLALTEINERNLCNSLVRQESVVFNDTTVENPIIEEYTYSELGIIDKGAKEQKLANIVKTTT